MCTLIAWHRGRDAALPGVTLAANRDELYARPALPPAALGGGIHAGVDVSYGGTWLGVHERGLVVGLTNQRSFGARDDTKLSRGEIVREALSRQRLDDALAYVRSLDARRYNGWNLLLGDGERLFAAYGRPSAPDVEIEELSQGVHVLGNERLRASSFPKALRIEREALDSLGALVDPDVPTAERALLEVLRSHRRPDLSTISAPPGSAFGPELIRELQATCIHTAQYGTVSSALITILPGEAPRYRYTEGPPCNAAIRDLDLAPDRRDR